MASASVTGNVLAADCGDLQVRVGLRCGDLLSIEYRGRAVINAGPATGNGFEVAIDGFRVPAMLTSWEHEPVEAGVKIKLSYTMCDGSRDAPASRRYAITQLLTITERPAAIERRLSIRRMPTGNLTGPEVDKLRSATLRLRGVSLGDPGRTSVSLPMLRVVPGTPLPALRARPRFFASAETPHADGHRDVVMTAPDCCPGCFTLSNDEGLHASITPTARALATHLRVFGEGGGVTVEHEFCCSSWMDTNTEADAGSQTIIFRDAGWRDALPAAGELLATLFPPKTDCPAWTDNAIVRECEPHFDGGFLGIRQKLQSTCSLGANAIYVMPWHRGGYSTIDYFTPEPRLGTLAELKDTIAAAHDLGLMVMFDLLVNIAQPESPLVKEHPEFFYRDGLGRPRPHVTWGGRCLDPGSPGLRRYLVDYACWCVGELGADGFRVDAAAHRGANWNCGPGLQPHEHSHAIFTLLDEIRDAIRKLNPQAILMAECFGPIQAAVSDIVCYQWLFWIDWAMELLADRRLRGADFQRLIAEQTMAMPAGTKLGFYSHTHDSLAFLHRDVRGSPARAYFASLAFLGAGVMFFGGGWGMPPRPEPDEADGYRRMFELRSRHNGFAGYGTAFPEAPERDLFAFTKSRPGSGFTFITNFSSEPRITPADGEVVFSRTNASRASGGRLEIAPYDTVVLAGNGRA